MQTKRAGRQTVQLSHPPSVVSFANIGGRMEGQGPSPTISTSYPPTPSFGKKTWEQGENPPCRSGSCAGRWKGVASPPVNWTTAGWGPAEPVHRHLLRPAGFHIPLLQAVRRLLHHGESLSLAPCSLTGVRPAWRRHDLLPLLHRRAAVPDAGPLRQPAHPHRPVDGHRLRLLYSGRSGGTALYHPSPAAASWTRASPTPTTWGPPWPRRLRHPAGALSLHTATGPEDYDLIVTGDLGLLGQQIVTDLFRQDGWT